VNKDEVLTATATVLLLFTALIDWNVYSWLILAGVVIVLMAWYFRKTDDNTPELVP
jgi:hypothetical protein